MAMIPLLRPAGSAHVLRYRGNVVVADQDLTEYPKENAAVAADTVITPTTFEAFARFALFNPGDSSPPLDAAALAEKTRRYPSHVYDDTTPAGAAPHPNVTMAAIAGYNATDIEIGDRTWAQNLLIHYNKIDSRVIVADVGLFAEFPATAGGVRVLLDTAASGLGLATGLPVVGIRFELETGQAVAPYAFAVDLTFEIRHTVIR